MPADCLFCNISKGKSETEFLFENDTLVVFRDINPQAPVHLLIVPKKHIRSINDIQQEDSGILAEMIHVAKKMARAHGVDQSGYKLFFNVEKGGGQVIFHIHLHLVGGWRGKWSKVQ